jgi:hypothetical protein
VVQDDQHEESLPSTRGRELRSATTHLLTLDSIALLELEELQRAGRRIQPPAVRSFYPAAADTETRLVSRFGGIGARRGPGIRSRQPSR